jgi:phosphopentomutase
MPNLGALGLGNITEIQGVSPVDTPKGFWGKARELSCGKDTTTGHWELMGVVTTEPFSHWPNGFPDEIIDEFVQATGRGVLGNRPASGTQIIQELGPKQIETGDWIVYTSADSVFQIAAHEEVIPLQELYQACETARRILDPYRVARVIARPYVGKPGAFQRTYNRRDFSMRPPQDTVMDMLKANGVPVVAIGKIHDIFAGQGIDRSIHTEGNTDGLIKTEQALRETRQGFIFTNLVDFDMLYGHRRDPKGYAAALEEMDAFWPRLVEAAGDDTLIILTADHGCDPTADWSTDHTREYIPILVWFAGIELGGALGVRETFADVGATVAFNFGIGPLRMGKAFEIF